MTHEELRAEKLEECKQEMYEEIQHERQMSEDREYAIEQYADEIQECYDKLNSICTKLFEYGYDIKPIELLEEI